jgi:hypothetical protein
LFLDKEKKLQRWRVESHVGRRSYRGGGLKVMLVEEATKGEG